MIDGRNRSLEHQAMRQNLNPFIRPSAIEPALVHFLNKRHWILHVFRAANTFYQQGFGQPILIGRKKVVADHFRELGIPLRPEFELIDTSESPFLEEFSEFLYSRLQRRGSADEVCAAPPGVLPPAAEPFTGA